MTKWKRTTLALTLFVTAFSLAQFLAVWEHMYLLAQELLPSGMNIVAAQLASPFTVPLLICLSIGLFFIIPNVGAEIAKPQNVSEIRFQATFLALAVVGSLSAFAVWFRLQKPSGSYVVTEANGKLIQHGEPVTISSVSIESVPWFWLLNGAPIALLIIAMLLGKRAGANTHPEAD